MLNQISLTRASMPLQRVLVYHFQCNMFTSFIQGFYGGYQPIQTDTIIRTSHTIDIIFYLQGNMIFDCVFFLTRSKYQCFLGNENAYGSYCYRKLQNNLVGLSLFPNPIKYVQWFQFRLCKM